MKQGKIKRAIVISDIHAPYENKGALKAVEKFMANQRFDYYINLGDLVDLDCISHHTKGKLRQVEGKRILEDYKYANKILDRHQSLIRKNNKDAQFILLEGNHEFRVQRYIDENPQMEGMIEIPVGLKLKDRGFKWVECYTKGDTYNIGHAYFHHGLYHNSHHAKKMVENFGTNIFYGHLHTFQSYSKVLRGNDKTIIGQSIGCLCDYQQSYIKSNPSAWQLGFAVIDIFPDGFFNFYPIAIFKNRFSFNGKKYE